MKIKQPMRVDYKGNKYVVKYIHKQRDQVYLGKHGILFIRGTTTAYIGDYKNPILSAKAYCSIHDQFEKKKGRIVSTVRLFKMEDVNEA